MTRLDWKDAYSDEVPLGDLAYRDTPTFRGKRIGLDRLAHDVMWLADRGLARSQNLQIGRAEQTVAVLFIPRSSHKQSISLSQHRWRVSNK
jgi:hypothetical protein